jgi:hypothetical protein
VASAAAFAPRAVTDTAPPSSLAQTATDQDLDLIQERASRLRGLDVITPIPRALMPRDELRAFYDQSFFEENPVEEIETTQLLLEVLGYVEPGFDIMGSLIDILEQDVLGFYDRKTKTVYVVADGEVWNERNTITFAHEITHALQDQHFDIGAGYAAREDNNDRTMAFQALVEGDATLLQTLYSLRFPGKSGSSDSSGDSASASERAFSQAPLILQRELMFPYDDGINFLIAPFREGMWKAVDEIWRNPPESTEQVLHPEKYLAREAPIDVQFPDPVAQLGEGWVSLDSDTLGEFDWRILLEQYTDSSTAQRAAAGWGGDRYRLLRRDADRAVLLAARTVWDTVDDAQEFYEAYQRVAAARHGPTFGVSAVEELLRGPLGGPSGAFSWAGRGGNWHHLLVRDGATVHLLITTDPSALSVIRSLRPADGRSVVPSVGPR